MDVPSWPSDLALSHSIAGRPAVAYWHDFYPYSNADIVDTSVPETPIPGTGIGADPLTAYFIQTWRDEEFKVHLTIRDKYGNVMTPNINTNMVSAENASVACGVGAVGSYNCLLVMNEPASGSIGYDRLKWAPFRISAGTPIFYGTFIQGIEVFGPVEVAANFSAPTYDFVVVYRNFLARDHTIGKNLNPIALFATSSDKTNGYQGDRPLSIGAVYSNGQARYETIEFQRQP